jgi:hypothetical protein
MESFIKYLTDFNSIQRFVNESNLQFRESLIEYFYQLAEKLGFEAKKNFVFSSNNLKFPAIDLVWLNAEQIFAAFAFEFASKDSFLANLFKLNESKADYCIIITSSNANTFKINEGKELLLKLKNVESKFLFIDITKEKFEFIQ